MRTAAQAAVPRDRAKFNPKPVEPTPWARTAAQRTSRGCGPAVLPGQRRPPPSRTAAAGRQATTRKGKRLPRTILAAQPTRVGPKNGHAPKRASDRRLSPEQSAGATNPRRHAGARPIDGDDRRGIRRSPDRRATLPSTKPGRAGERVRGGAATSGAQEEEMPARCKRRFISGAERRTWDGGWRGPARSTG